MMQLNRPTQLQNFADNQYIRYPGVTNDFDNPIYSSVYQDSIDNKEKFWEREALDLSWQTKFTSALDQTD